MDRDGSGDQDDVIVWLGLAAGLHEDVVNEAKLRLRSEQVYVVGDLALLVEEGGLSDVFTTRVSARKVRDALRLRSAAQPATVGCPAGGRSRAAAEQEATVEAAVEVTTGGVGASAPTAAEWDDRGEPRDYSAAIVVTIFLSVARLRTFRCLSSRGMLAAATLLRRSPERERRCGLSCRGASGCWIAVGDLRVTRIRRSAAARRGRWQR